MEKTILMFLLGPLDTDGRVLRTLDTINEMGQDVTVLTSRSKKDFSHGHINHVILNVGWGGWWTFFRFNFKCLQYAIRYRKSTGIYYMQDNTTTLLGYLISLFTKKPIIYDAHELLLRRKTEKVTLRSKFFIFFEKKLIRRAFYIIEANEERMRIVKHVYKLKNITYVMNITNEEFEHIGARVKPYKQDEDFNLVYQGSLFESRHMSFYIKAMKYLPENVKLVLIGGGDLDFYRNLVKELQLSDRITITGSLPKAEMFKKLAPCHAGIITYSFATPNDVYCAPNKIFEYAAWHIPMLSTAQPFLERSLNDYGIGTTFKEDDFEDYKESFQRLIEMPILDQSFNEFLARYNFNNEKKKLKMVIQKAIDSIDL